MPLTTPARYDTFADLSLMRTESLDDGQFHPDQVSGIEFLLRTPRAVLADAPGRGKTAQLIGYLAHFKAEGRVRSESGWRALFVVPTAQLAHQTLRAFATLCPSMSVVDMTGGTKCGAELPDADVLIVTYALLCRRLDTFEVAGFRYLIGDEASSVKGDGPQHEAFEWIAWMASRVVMATATAYETGFLELHAIVSAAGIDAGTQQQWGEILCESHKINKTGTIRWGALKPEAPRILRSWLDPVLLRREGPLPGVRYPSRTGDIYRIVTPTAAQRSALTHAERMHKYSPLKAHGMAKAATAGVGEGSLRQGAKAKAMTDWLTSRQEVDKALVYSESTKTLDFMESTFNASGITTLRVDGSYTKTKRLSAVDQFEQDPSVRVLLGTSVLSRGLNLQFCRVILSHDGWDNPAAAEQLEGRVCRPGSPHETYEFVTFLLDHPHDQKRLHRATRRSSEASLIVPENAAYHSTAH